MNRKLRLAGSPAVFVLLCGLPAVLSWSWPAVRTSPAASPFLFVDVTSRAGLDRFVNVQGSASKDYILETTGGGAAFLDYNNDGWQDVLLVRGSTIENFKRGGDPVCTLFRNNGNGTFTDVTRSSGLDKKGWGQGVCVGDYDNDGWQDIYVTGYGPNFLFHNDGDGTFSDASNRSGTADRRWSVGAAFGDYDRDGFLDLYVCNYIDFDINSPPFRDEKCTYKGIQVFCGPRGLKGSRDTLFHNNGDGTFSDVSDRLGIDPERLYGLGVAFADYDNDGDGDIYVANDLTANLLYRNNGNGTFTESALLAGVAYDEDGLEEGSMGLDFGDYDNDGWLDLHYTNSSYQVNALHQNARNGTFTNKSYASGQGQPSWLYVGWGTAFADLDNDGWLDLLVVNGHLYPEAERFNMGISYKQRILCFHNRSGAFGEVGMRAGKALTAPRNSRGSAYGDYDNDGDIDVLVNNLDGPPALLRNEAGNRNSWILVKTQGSQSNRDGIGARLIVKTSAGAQVREIKSGSSYASSNDLRAHFGLGNEKLLERIDIRWPSGKLQTLTNVKANRIVSVTEPEKNRP